MRGHRFQACWRALGKSVNEQIPGTGHVSQPQAPVRGEQRPVVAVTLSDDQRRVNGSVEPLLEQRLQERQLVLDDQDLIDAHGDGRTNAPWPGNRGP